MRRLRAAAAILGFALAVSAGACVGSVPPPTPEDAAWAAARWPGSSLAELERGRELFLTRCAGCHALPSPGQHPPEAWGAIVDDMSDEAELTRPDRDVVVRYLETASARMRSSQGSTARAGATP